MKTSKTGKQYTSGVRPWLKNVAWLSSLMRLHDHRPEVRLPLIEKFHAFVLGTETTRLDRFH